MKYFIILSIIFCSGSADKEVEIIGTDLKYINFELDNLNLNLTKEFFDEFKQELENANARAGGITAIVNDYADKVLANIQQLIIRSGLDPVELPDQVLKFTYHYRTKVILLSISGGAEGTVKSVKANVVLSFNFQDYQASLDEFDIRDTGKIGLRFTGNGLVDWITNTMTSVVSLFLHPLIIRIIESIVKGGMQAVVAAVNGVLNDVLHHEALNYLT